MYAFAAFLPLAILLPLAALILHGAAPARGASKSRNLAHAKASLIFQWGFGAFLAWISIMAMSVPEGLVLKGGSVPLGMTSLLIEPALYLDGRNAPFLLLMGL